MSVSLHDDVLDAASDEIINNATKQHICAGAPASVAELSTKSLGYAAMSSGDFTKANGDTSGRKVTVAAKAGVSLTADGTWDHVALADATRILAVDPLTASRVVYSGGTVNVAAWDIEFRDPTAS